MIILSSVAQRPVSLCPTVKIDPAAIVHKDLSLRRCEIGSLSERNTLSGKERAIQRNGAEMTPSNMLTFNRRCANHVAISIAPTTTRLRLHVVLALLFVELAFFLSRRVLVLLVLG